MLGPLLMIREAVKYFGPRGGSIINIGPSTFVLNSRWNSSSVTFSSGSSTL